EQHGKGAREGDRQGSRRLGRETAGIRQGATPEDGNGRNLPTAENHRQTFEAIGFFGPGV
ncbi:MAG: hypothetical protein ACOVMT_08500, partial [Caulobacter sp.]